MSIIKHYEELEAEIERRINANIDYVELVEQLQEITETVRAEIRRICIEICK